jgi:thiamine-monophosphate kinase
MNGAKNEDQVLQKIFMRFQDLRIEDRSFQRHLGWGDDSALLDLEQLPKDEYLCISSDSLVEGVHFKDEHLSPADVGWKSLAVNLSDVAAMGAQPYAFLLNLSLPQKKIDRWLEMFLEGLHECAVEYSIPLIGGDCTNSLRDAMISISVIGRCLKSQVRKRSGACARDLIFVTAPVGDSAAGLELCKISQPLPEPQLLLKRRHQRPRPQISEGRFLAHFSEVHSLMDVSDGLFLDLPKLAHASKLGFKAQVDQLPISAELRQTFSQEALEYACLGGEDYVLLGSCAETFAPELSRRFFDKFQKALNFFGKFTESMDHQWLNGSEVWKPQREIWEHWKA